LPLEPNSFVGREHELGELRRLLRGTRVLTLCGAGGIGKTRLALRILAAEAGEFPDGVWFVELADLRQPELVVSRIAAAVGVTEEAGRPLLETLADALRARRLLLALDNCEHLIDVCARVCQHLLAHAPQLHMLATSREPLHVAAETVWQVPPLSVAPIGMLDDAFSYEAVRLFADRAAASFPGFAVGPANATAVAALCRALDGMPLAIELAAARVRALSVDQIRTRLADRFGLLTSGDRTAPERQRTLRAAIEWSHELLTIPEQVLLRRLSVFAGWSLEMAEQVCSDEVIPPEDILDLLAALVDKSLVVREPEELGQARYRMLDTIREYAAARLAEADETAPFHRRLRDYTVHVAEQNLAVGMAQTPAPWSARVDVFRRFDVDYSTIVQVLNWCLAEGDVESGLRLCTAARPCWLVRGTFAEASDWLDSFLRLDMAGISSQVRGAALVGRAQLALSSDPVTAESAATDGLELCRLAGDVYWTAAALNLLSEITLHTRRADEAWAHASEALAIARASGDNWHEGYALGTQAAIAGQRGNLREAQRLANESIGIMRAIDQQWGVARTLLGLGDLARVRRDPDDASRHYLQALPILREIDARPETARCLAGLGRVAIELGALELAREHLSESIRLSHHTGARIGVARGLAAFAALAMAEKQPELAVRLIAAATALREVAGLPGLPGAQTERYLAAARYLGDAAVARLWAEGLALSSDQAVALALDTSTPAGQDAAQAPAPGVVLAPPGSLTPRERQIVALITGGRSNKAIADELVISPATAARHVANIMGKLGFTSRAQIAAWAAGQQLDLIQPPAARPPAARPPTARPPSARPPTARPPGSTR
jgi:predicted ATPase/DNA-binding CsgD family transcriptional regulator